MAKPGRGTITETVHRGVTWVHCAGSGPRELDMLRKRFGFAERDIRDIPPPTQRPKAALRDGYLFVILLFPVFDRTRKEVAITEVDFFIGKDFLVTVNQGNRVQAVSQAVARCQQSPADRRVLLGAGPLGAFSQLLDAMLSAVFPMLVHIGEDIEHVEQGLFDPRDTGVIHDILRVKTNVTNCRRAMMAYKGVIERLNVHDSPAGTLPMATHHRLTDMTKEIWNLLESHRETLAALQDTNLAVLTLRTNEIIRTLTVFSVIMLPLTLITGLFGMNTEFAPLVHLRWGFWIVVGMMAGTGVVLALYFRSRKWW